MAQEVKPPGIFAGRVYRLRSPIKRNLCQIRSAGCPADVQPAEPRAISAGVFQFANSCLSR